jgi:hypothetical protein
VCEPKGVWVPLCPNPKGFGSFRVATQYELGLGCWSGPIVFGFGSVRVRA